MDITKVNFIETLKKKLKAGDIIGTVAYARVSKIISGLRDQLAAAQSGSIKAVAASTTAAKAAEEKTRVAEMRIKDAEKKAETAETAVVQALQQIDDGEQVTKNEMLRLNNTMELMRKAAAVETAEQAALIVNLKDDYGKLMNEKNIAETSYRQLFVQALTELDDALGGLSVNTLEQSGGFQSSSSGNYDYKKYRSSSRSYSKQIKDLKKKRKQSKKERKKSKKIRRDRKKRSTRNKTRKR